MKVDTRRTVVINDSVMLADLVKLWFQGQHGRDKVIDILETDHPGLTAMFACELVQIADRNPRHLLLVNELANLMIDRRRSLLLEADADELLHVLGGES